MASGGMQTIPPITAVMRAPATPEKGERWFEDRSHALAKVIRLIKDDHQAQRLQDEFFDKLDPPQTAG